MRKNRMYLILTVLMLVLASCSSLSADKDRTRVGLLVPHTINDQVWGTKGYKGLLKLQSRYGFEVFYQEEIASKQAITESVKQFHEDGIELVFGHGSEYVEVFNELAPTYPAIHFISFNGEATETNTTSLSFEGYAMGFFGGMVAAQHSTSKELAVIAAYPWQPEISGFKDGATYQYPSIKVHTYFTNGWNNVESALAHLKTTKETTKSDVYYPAGDGYNIPLIQQIKADGKYAIGYVSDQSDISRTTVLTSTVQHVDKLYDRVAKRYIEGDLPSGSLTFDMEDGVISLGKFSPLLDKTFTKELNQHMEDYISTGKLPGKQ